MMIKNRVLDILLLILALVTLAGCSGDNCIDADDFGFSKFTVSSRYDSTELYSQQQDRQIAPWRDSGYTVNGRPLLMVVKTWQYNIEKNNTGQLSAWCPWYGLPGDEHKLSKFCTRLTKCQFIGGKMCPIPPPKDAPISNAPCLLKDGVGLYAAITEKGTDPNATFETQKLPAGITMHLGEPPVGYTLYDIGQDGSIRTAGGIAYKYEEIGENPADVKSKYANAPLYFKILDKFYEDNNGQYKIVIKSGVNDSRPDPIEFLTNLVKQNLFGVDGKDYGLIRNIYQNITKNPSYRIMVNVILSIYIALSALSFLTGNLNVTQAELITRIVKVIIISLLLRDEYSWTFFNDYLFVYFVDGMAQILSIIQEAAATGSGPSSILGLMIAPQTIAKVLSLLFVDWLGFIYIILFFIALYFIFMMLFEATIIYLTALIAIGMIIIMGPIFLCFMLFQVTRSLFENWLKQLISYAMQPLILFTGLAFISIIIRTEIYSTLGFRVCKFDFPNLGAITAIFGTASNIAEKVGLDDSITQSLFYWWFPNPMRGSDFSRAQGIIPVPMDYFQPDGTPNGKFCEAYGCNEMRYIELPFLDPVADIDRINKFFNGKFVQLDGLFLIFVAVYLLSKFNQLAVSVSKFLSSSTGNLTDLEGAGHAAFAPIEKQINRPIDAAIDRVDRAREKISATAAGAYEGYMMDSVRKEALTDSANNTVLEEVRRKYGMSASDLRPNAIKDYETEFRKKITTINNEKKEGEEKISEDKIKEMLLKDYRDLGEKKYLGPLDHKDLKLQELSADARFAKDFQDIYAKTHQEMSGRGLGILGKNIKGFRDFKEMDYRVKEKKKLDKVKRRQFAENLYSGYEGIKRAAFTGLAGEKLRDQFEGNLTGAHWHDYDYTDPRLRTYTENLKDQERAVKAQELAAQINRETIKAQDDILRPEYLANLEKSGNRQKLEMYQTLARDKIATDVYNQLTREENPVLMGEKFIREKATDTQLKEMIDKINQTNNNLIYNDSYIRREDKYEVIQAKAAQVIQDQQKDLRNKYGRDISVSEMAMSLEQLHAANPLEAKKQVQDLKNSLAEFERASAVLEKINERKDYIDQEINKYKDEINGHRTASGMKEYNPTENQGPRRVRKIEDYLSGS